VIQQRSAGALDRLCDARPQSLLGSVHKVLGLLCDGGDRSVVVVDALLRRWMRSSKSGGPSAPVAVPAPEVRTLAPIVMAPP
jgi:hypothetical protein